MGYVLFDEIAAGGMAAVHFGRLGGQHGFSRVVAVKRLHRHLARERDFVSMFLDEARLAARVRHPNVVATIDVVAEDEVFIVMEYIQGESVSRLVRAEKNRGQLVPLPFAVAIMASTLHGLHAAHDAVDEMGQPLGLVHRDVSPQNILVGIDGVPRVFDFGVAKAAGRLQDTRDGSLKGKVAYMSPEQLSGRNVTRRSDIYSASVLLWELLTGKRLFEAENEAAIIPKIMAPQLEPPSKHNRAVSAALDEIVMRGLMFDPDRRFPTARAMAQELERRGGGVVAASDIGEWVSELAHEAIAKRAARIKDIESRDITSMAGARTGPLSGMVPAYPNTMQQQSSASPPPSMRMPTLPLVTTTMPPSSSTPPTNGGAPRRMMSDPSANPPTSLPHYAPPEQPSNPIPLPSVPPDAGSGAYPAQNEPSTHGGVLVAPEPPKRRGGAVFGFLLVCLLLLGGGGFVVWKYGPRHGIAFGQGPAPTVTTSASSAPTVTLADPSGAPSTSAAPSDSSTTATAPSASASAIPSASASAAASATSAPPPKDVTGNAKDAGASPSKQNGGTLQNHPRPQPSAKPPKDDCDPPYVIDADGHKVYKRNCL